MKRTDAAKLVIGNKVKLQNNKTYIINNVVASEDSSILKFMLKSLDDEHEFLRDYRKIKSKVISHVIFLDVDGVLNTSHTDERTPIGFVGVEDKYIEFLQELVKDYNADIVLTSDWKEEWEPKYEDCGIDIQYLWNKLKKYGLCIIDKTTDRSKGNDATTGRGAGIHDYLKTHPEITNWVVIDDNFFGDFDKEIQDHFVFIPKMGEGFGVRRLVQAEAVMDGNIMKPKDEPFY